MATAAQVADRFELGRAVSHARLSGLVRLGQLEHARIFHGAPGVYLAIRTGLATVDLDLPPARVDLRTYVHDLELSSLVVEVEREFGREEVSTEREMRAADIPLGAAPTTHTRFAVPLAGARGQLQLMPAGHPPLHFPDCAVAGRSAEIADRVLAIELEPTARDGHGCAASWRDTSPPDTSALCATTRSATACASLSKARSLRSGLAN